MNATVPSDHVFWSIVEASGVREGLIPTGLWPLIEDEFPIDAADVWATGVPIEGGRVAVCAIRTTDLEGLDSITLTPETVPDFVPAAADRFNFLIGEYEPIPLRRARFRRHLIAAACTLLAACLIGVGLSRRTDAWKSEIFAARTSVDRVIASIAPTQGWAKDELAIELLQRRQSVPSDILLPADAGTALAAVIAQWPTQATSKPQSISATGSSASIAVTVPGDAQAFLSSLKPPKGWMLDEPRLAAMDKATRLNLELRRVTGEGR